MATALLGQPAHAATVSVLNYKDDIAKVFAETTGIGGEAPSLVPIGNICGQPSKKPQMVSQTDPWDIRTLYRRMGWRIAAALRQFKDTADDAFHLDGCGTVHLEGVLPDGKNVTEMTFHCRNRLCPTCRAARARGWQKKLQPYMRHDSHLLLDGNGQIVQDERHWNPATGELENREEWAAARFAEAIELDRRIAQPQRTKNREKRLERMSERHEETLYPLFVTLTMPNIPHLVTWNKDGEMINELDRRLWQPWRRMRETARRRPNSRAGRLMGLIMGGIWVTEVTHRKRHKKYTKGRRIRVPERHKRNGRKGRVIYLFHPHIHCIVWSKKSYIHKLALQRVWNYYAPGAKVVDVRRVTDGLAQDLVKDPGDVQRWSLINYLLGGNAKKLETTQDGKQDFKERRYPPEFWHELALATKNRRLVNTFGLLRGLKEPQEVDGEDVQDVASSNTGTHVLRQWDRKTRAYVVDPVKGRWPATPDDPIIPMKERLRRGQTFDHVIGQIFDRQIAAARTPRKDRWVLADAAERVRMRGSPQTARETGLAWVTFYCRTCDDYFNQKADAIHPAPVLHHTCGSEAKKWGSDNWDEKNLAVELSWPADSRPQGSPNFWNEREEIAAI